MKKSYDEIFNKYIKETPTKKQTVSRDFKLFLKDERTGFMKRYESLCKSAGKILMVSIPDEEKKRLQNAIKLNAMSVTPEEIGSLSLLALLMTIMFTGVVAVIFFMFNLLTGVMSLIVLGLGLAGILMYDKIRKYPIGLIETRRIRSSNELVLSILYIVSYMRHTSNLEEAIRFAASNLEGPLSNDFIKMIWDIQARKYSDIQDALNNYLMNWKEFNPAFVDAMYLIRSTLYQGDEANRLALLDESVNRILDGTFRNMVNYASSLRNPINTIYMMGIVLPVLGMVMFPMVSTFMAESISTEIMIVGYNIILPLLVFLLAKNILKNRPSGFPYVDISGHPEIAKRHYFYLGKKQYPAIIPAIIAFLVMAGPFIFLLMITTEISEIQIYLSIPITFAAAAAIYVYTRLTTTKPMSILKKVYSVENDFSHAIFQLGTILVQEVPVEQAFIKVASSMKGSETSDFLRRVVNNIRSVGLSASDALFHKEYGAVLMFPSPIIKSTMKVLVDTSKKSLKDAGIALIFVSKYLRSLKEIDDRVNDSLDEVLSSMHFQVAFLSPIISGIVVGMTALITMVLEILSERISSISDLLGTGSDVGGAPSLMFLTGMFGMSQATPLHLFQLMVGLYTVEVVIVISYMLSNITRPGDPYYFEYTISKMILIPAIIYAIVTGLMTLVLGGLARLAVGVTDVLG